MEWFASLFLPIKLKGKKMRYRVEFMAFGVVVGMLFALYSGDLQAKPKASTESVLTASTFEAFEQDATGLREAMRTGRFSLMTEGEKANVARDLDEIGELLKAKGSVDRLSQIESVRLINAQERANATLLKNDGDRLICEYRRPTGSNRKEKFCTTVLEARRARAESRQAAEDIASRSQPAVPGGGR